MDLHIQPASEIPLPDAGDTALLASTGSESAVVAGNTAGGPYRRIIQPAKALVSRSRILRESAQASIDSKAKLEGAGRSTCYGCFCCPKKAEHADPGTNVASLAFETEK
jgi:hypothetical protein